MMFVWGNRHARHHGRYCARGRFRARAGPGHAGAPAHDDGRRHAARNLLRRAESAAKDLLDLGGPDPPGFIEFHRISHVAALTLGYVRDVSQQRWGRIGGDATVYHVPDNMLEFYGAPHSFHVFVRYRPLAMSHAHMH
jgi:hypothetical protein